MAWWAITLGLVLGVALALLALAWVRAGVLPWRQLLLWGYQVTCWARGHQWAEREVDLMQALPGFRNPYLWVCGRCGAAAVRDAYGEP